MSSELRCRFPGCGRNVLVVRDALCRSHYRQQREGKELRPIAAKLPDGSGPADALAKYSPVGLPRHECWEWQGPRYKNGYGVAHVPGRAVGYAHRVAWEVANGRLLTADEHVRHKCDNRPCVNPSHLEVGTRQQNMTDMVERDRSVRGERNGMQHIRPGVILEIRRRAAEGERQKDLAAEFGISRPHVSDIVRRKRWAHL